jgi:hypothetical protein
MNCTSMRDVQYKGKLYNIHNHFFWLSRKEAMDIYKAHGADFLYQDAVKNPIPYEVEESESQEGLFFFDEPKKEAPQWRLNGDPYLSHVLPTLNLSPLAREVLECLQEAFIWSLDQRKDADPSLHLHAWDSGVYQLNKLLKGEPQWDKVKTKGKELAKSLEHGVYTFGFLKK